MASTNTFQKLVNDLISTHYNELKTLQDHVSSLKFALESTRKDLDQERRSSHLCSKCSSLSSAPQQLPLPPRTIEPKDGIIEDSSTKGEDTLFGISDCDENCIFKKIRANHVAREQDGSREFSGRAFSVNKEFSNILEVHRTEQITKIPCVNGRRKSKVSPPTTPPGYWDLDFCTEPGEEGVKSDVKMELVASEREVIEMMPHPGFIEQVTGLYVENSESERLSNYIPNRLDDNNKCSQKSNWISPNHNDSCYKIRIANQVKASEIVDEVSPNFVTQIESKAKTSEDGSYRQKLEGPGSSFYEKQRIECTEKLPFPKPTEIVMIEEGD